MCERAVLTNRPSLNLSPFVLEGHKSLSGSEGQRCRPSKLERMVFEPPEPVLAKLTIETLAGSHRGRIVRKHAGQQREVDDTEQRDDRGLKLVKVVSSQSSASKTG